MLSVYVACVLIVAVLLKYSWWRRKFPVPGRKHALYNILGDLTEFNLTKELLPQILNVISKILRSCPQKPLVCTWISYYPMVFVVKADAAKEMFKTHKLIEKSFHYDWLKPVFGNGVVTCSKSEWKSRRKILNPCFHSDVLRNYFEPFNKLSQQLVKVLQKETHKDYTDPFNLVSVCAFDAICETAFGTEVGALARENFDISNSLQWCESSVMKRILTIWLWPDIIAWNTKIGKEAKKHINKIQEFVKKILKEKKAAYLKGDRTSKNGKHKDVIDQLLEKQLDTLELSEQDATDEVSTLMMAGHDTIAAVVTWSLYLIGQHPEVQTKIHEEVDRAFGTDTKRAVTEEDLKNLEYLDCVLKETLRLYPAVPIFGRCATEDINICGYTVPKGTDCAIMIYYLHRDKDVFPDPERFDPDRFSAENRKKIPDFGYIPFGAGPRNCIGYKFSEIEIGIIMSDIFRNFHVESMNKVLPIPGISLHSSEPIQIKFSSRNRQET